MSEVVYEHQNLITSLSEDILKNVSVYYLTVSIFLFTAIFITGICAANDLVLHLSLDELKGDVAKDWSEFGNDATFNGNPELIDGKFGKAINFDGKTWAEVSDHASIDIVDGITVEFWANVRPGGDVQTGIEKGATWGAGLYTLAAFYRGGSILQFFDLPDNCDDENKGGSIQDGTWHFLAGTWDGKTIKLYIDGELNAEMECAGKLSPNNGALFIGARGGTERFLNGALDEIKMYDYALTQEELKDDMENPLPLSVQPEAKLTTTWARLKAR